MRKHALGLIIPLTLASCDRAPDPTAEWTSADHDHQPQAGQQAAPAGSNRLTPQQQLAESAWAQSCNACHGPMGHGDGPNGPLVKAPDLTREDWQAKVTDEEIATRIRTGKGLMPPNDLPDSAIRGLVARIRALRGQ